MGLIGVNGRSVGPSRWKKFSTTRRDHPMQWNFVDVVVLIMSWIEAFHHWLPMTSDLRTLLAGDPHYELITLWADTWIGRRWRFLNQQLSRRTGGSSTSSTSKVWKAAAQLKCVNLGVRSTMSDWLKLSIREITISGLRIGGFVVIDLFLHVKIIISEPFEIIRGCEGQRQRT